MKTKLCLLSLMLWGGSLSAFSQGFGVSGLVSDWRFHLGDEPRGASVEFDHSGWRKVTVPHDWSVELPASSGQSSCTGYLPGGTGWYRTELAVPAESRGKRLYLYFEGVYNRSEVFVNGVSVGKRPNGYVSFMYDITDRVVPGGKNVVAVRVDHGLEADSRWYTGSGIYRDVHLVAANPVHIGLWGVYYTSDVNKLGSAVLNVEASIENDLDKNVDAEVVFFLSDPSGGLIAMERKKFSVSKNGRKTVKQQLKVAAPKLWNLQNPNLYDLKTRVAVNGKVVDESTTKAGIRSVNFDPDKGFALNGEWMKIKGVCLHHDAGVLGAAVPKAVWRDRLLKLKEIGCNGIRMSHNPQATDLYDLCDELGFLVMDEAFDEWEFPKKKWIEGWNKGDPGFEGSADFFEEWAERDLESMVLRDRNHPSIVMWSIGNEVDYPNDPYSHPVLDTASIGFSQPYVPGYKKDQPPAERLGDIAKKLAAVVRGIDRSRPVTAALAGAVMSNETDYPGALDIVGYNYTEYRYRRDHETYPDRVLYGSETGHGLEAWRAVSTNDFIFGQFLWTGIDYLGESGRWPARGSTSGLIDLANNIKPRGYFRKALWADEPMAYLGSHLVEIDRNKQGDELKKEEERAKRPSMDAGRLWNYADRQPVRVVCYTNGDEAELFLNGTPAGERKSCDPETAIIFWDIPFRSGELKVVAYRDGKPVAADAIRSDGIPHALETAAEKTALNGMRDVVAIPVSVVDEEGDLVYRADHEVTCTVAGAGKLLGLENASRNAFEDFGDNTHQCKNGRLLAYVQATADEGTIEVSFASPGLESAKVELKVGK